jgi:hypothetical protein
MSPGAPKGNQNGTKHGLFSTVLAHDPVASAVYEAAWDKDPSELARDAAQMLIGRIATAMQEGPDIETAKGQVAEALRGAVARGEVSRDHANAMIKKMHAPDPANVAKALAPLRGLLARLDAADAEAARNAPTGLIVVEAKSADWAQTQSPPALPPGE